MDHYPYPKVPTTLPDGSAAGASWIATEKIHGAQLVIGIDGDEIRFGKRKAWLAADEPFFGWQMLRNPLEQAARTLRATCDRPGPIFLYGELFGGGYPHERVAALPGIGPVQTGIWYAPDLRFALFDILVLGDEPIFLAHGEVEELAAAAELLLVPTLARGSRRELQALPVRYPSVVAELLGLPAIAGNVAEGFVLKPDAELPAERRPVVKHKIPEFSENRFDESQPFDAHAHLALPELLQLAAAMVNPARIASARSKVGEQLDAIVEEALLDVSIDLEAMFPRRMLALSEAEDAALRAGLLELIERACQA